jgi:CheY-like chemotaxis protein
LVTTALVHADQVQAGRTLEARSAALEEALQRATEGDRRKDEFLATLAHELRNQLGPVMSSLEVIKRAAADTNLLGRARTTMERQLLHMNRLVDDLLDVSRIARDQLELRMAPVDLGVTLEYAVEASRPAIEAAGHNLTLTPSREPVLLEADSVRLTQVFGNLLTNACKYTDPGGRIDVAVELQGSDVVVHVADNGWGIPPGLLGTVFERFVQVDRSAERAQGGLGIGLALARQLVELHGGTLTAQSEGLGQGSEFLVRLPILSNRSLVLASAPVLAHRVQAHAHRILLVDDNRDAVESLAVLLTIAGYEVRTAHDGAAAIEQAASYRPEVILLDIGLPKLNGYEVCRRIRAEPWGKAMVVIALTGWGQEDDRRQTAQAGFTGHLVKPVDYALLSELLARVGEPAQPCFPC